MTSPRELRNDAASPAEASGLRLARADLPGGTLEVLSRGGWANPDVLLVQVGRQRVVVKDFAPRSAWVRVLLGRWLCRRELRAYCALEGIAAVPRCLGSLDALALVFEYRPGTPLSRAIPPGFLDELRRAVAAMHARGVVHLDLRHYSNILTGEDGHPVVLDFSSALCFERWGAIGRRLLPCLAWIDRLALRKWEARLGPARPAGQPSPEVEPPSEGSCGAPSAGSRGASRPM